MSNAIGLRFVPFDEKRHALNHFLGTPVLPKSLMEDFDDDVLFLGQIRLADIADLDEENHLPHEGYLYFFLDTSETERRLIPIIRYVEEEPNIFIDDFNDRLAKDGYPSADKARGIEFVKVPADDEGCKLLGVPCDWNYETAPKDPLLLQLSHYDEGFNFLPQLDGYTYIFFGPKGRRFDEAYGFYEYS